MAAESFKMNWRAAFGIVGLFAFSIIAFFGLLALAVICDHGISKLVDSTHTVVIQNDHEGGR